VWGPRDHDRTARIARPGPGHSALEYRDYRAFHRSSRGGPGDPGSCNQGNPGGVKSDGTGVDDTGRPKERPEVQPARRGGPAGGYCRQRTEGPGLRRSPR